MAISLLAYVATFSGQLYFWRNYFTLLQSNCFDTKVTISEQLYLQRCYFFEELPFSEQPPLRSSHFFQNSCFFRAKLLPRAGTSLEQLLFGTMTFLVEKLFRIKIFSDQVLFRTRYFLRNFSRRVTFWEKPIFWKSNIPHCLLFQDSYFFKRLSIAATFSEELLFHNILYLSVIQ